MTGFGNHALRTAPPVSPESLEFPPPREHTLVASRSRKTSHCLALRENPNQSAYPVDGYIRLWYIPEHDHGSIKRDTGETRADGLLAMEANGDSLCDCLADEQGRDLTTQLGSSRPHL
jgi:hypothetical protein